ncbi:hypothetical protein BH23BAC3_BH23BAC3_34430 [soil metagenome]
MTFGKSVQPLTTTRFGYLGFSTVFQDYVALRMAVAPEHAFELAQWGWKFAIYELQSIQRWSRTGSQGN